MTTNKLIMYMLPVPQYLSLLWIIFFALGMLNDTEDSMGAYFFLLFGYGFYIVYGVLYLIITAILIRFKYLRFNKFGWIFVLQPVVLGVIFLVIPGIAWIYWNVIVLGK